MSAGTILDMLGRDDWLAQVAEPPVDPARPIIDPHHHLWPGAKGAYQLPELRRDQASGHNITATVFIECLANYRPDGPEHLRQVGETAYVAALAAQSRVDGGPPIAAIIGHIDLTRPDTVDAAVAAHLEAGQGLFRGIRHAASFDPAIGPGHHNAPAGLYRDAGFRRGFAAYARHGLSFDAWLYHPQLPDLADLAAAFPDTTIIVDHFGGPLGAGASDHAATFAAWRTNLAAVARCPNTVVKLGGLAMPVNGFPFHRAARPPTSDDVVAAQADWYHAAIDLFGPDRCMFESNFPVDRQSLAYGTYWNAVQKIAARYTDAEQAAMFGGTAARVYAIA